jgi:hypothetical protein
MLERRFHKDQSNFSACLKENLGSSKVTMKAVKDGRKHYSPSSLEKLKKLIGCLLLLLIPMTLYVTDVALDCTLVHQYWIDAFSENGTNDVETCRLETFSTCNNTSDLAHLKDVTKKFDPVEKFGFALAFVLLPLILYATEWYSNAKIVKQVKLKHWLRNLQICTRCKPGGIDLSRRDLDRHFKT